MVFRSQGRCPTGFGQGEVVAVAEQPRCENSDAATDNGFRREWPREAAAVDAPNMERVALLERNLEGQKGGTRKPQPPFPVLAISKASNRRPPETDTTSGTSLTIGAVSSFSARDSVRSDSHASECSSLAPYWIPDQIKHYFRHRHSEEDNSDKTDLALRAIGLERELPAIDDTDWARLVFL
ncbi:hypothetical protein HPB50_015445 [Hyalomma asiaticum]|uniref:Uncharacterized protein n=1 Tax=Hyalomma asiaticum TaxID=266040 RepID=A0ACB7SYN2_HYAAI|nr:hypothetical protein HPB50_015445 [Hyalomma asiaticum]